MEFRIVEGEVGTLEKVIDELEEAYFHSSETVGELIKKYSLRGYEWKQFREHIHEKYGLCERPRKEAKHYTRAGYGYTITKSIDGKPRYIGYVPSEEVAKKMVALCKRVDWDIHKCKLIVGNWRKYV